MKKGTSPVLKTGVVLLLSGIFVISIFAFPVLYYYNQSIWKYTINNFDIYEKDFQIVSDFIKDFFVSAESESINNHNSHSLYVEFDHELFSYYLMTINESDLSSKRIETSYEVTDSLSAINNAFVIGSNSVLNCINYSKEMISFEIENGQYSLVYSFNDLNPTFVNNTDDNYNIKVKKIKESWYHVVVVP